MAMMKGCNMEVRIGNWVNGYSMQGLNRNKYDTVLSSSIWIMPGVIKQRNPWRKTWQLEIIQKKPVQSGQIMELRNTKGLKHDLKVSIAFELLRDVRAKILKNVSKKVRSPWMKHKEIDTISEVLLNLDPRVSLEWGAGYSTVTFPKLLSPGYEWLSIEHNKEWAEKMNLLNSDSDVTIEFIPSNTNGTYQDKYRDGSYEDFKDYIEFPDSVYDFILIDGRARSECLKRSHEIISSNGFVILHDANRRHYHEYFYLFKFQKLFLDYHENQRGIWIGSKNLPIESVLNIPKFEKLWRIHNRIGRFFGKK